MAEAQNVLASSSKLIAEQFKGMSESKLRFCARETVCVIHRVGLRECLRAGEGPVSEEALALVCVCVTERKRECV